MEKYLTPRDCLCSVTMNYIHALLFSILYLSTQYVFCPLSKSLRLHVVVYKLVLWFLVDSYLNIFYFLYCIKTTTKQSFYCQNWILSMHICKFLHLLKKMRKRLHKKQNRKRPYVSELLSSQKCHINIFFL